MPSTSLLLLHCPSLSAALTSVRSAALRQQLATLSAEHGRYSEPPTEKALIRLLEENDGVVVHFYKADFRRCKIVDRHLEVRVGRAARRGRGEAGAGGDGAGPAQGTEAPKCGLGYVCSAASGVGCQSEVSLLLDLASWAASAQRASVGRLKLASRRHLRITGAGASLVEGLTGAPLATSTLRAARD